MPPHATWLVVAILLGGCRSNPVPRASPGESAVPAPASPVTVAPPTAWAAPTPTTVGPPTPPIAPMPAGPAVTPPAPLEAAPLTGSHSPLRAGQVEVAESPIRQGTVMLALQIRGEAKGWKGLRVYGKEGKEIAFLTVDAEHPGPATSELWDTARFAERIHVELWAAGEPSGQHVLVETRELERGQCDGEISYVLWNFD